MQLRNPNKLTDKNGCGCGWGVGVGMLTFVAIRATEDSHFFFSMNEIA